MGDTEGRHGPCRVPRDRTMVCSSGAEGRPKAEAAGVVAPSLCRSGSSPRIQPGLCPASIGIGLRVLGWGFLTWFFDGNGVVGAEVEVGGGGALAGAADGGGSAGRRTVDARVQVSYPLSSSPPTSAYPERGQSLPQPHWVGVRPGYCSLMLSSSRR